MAIIVGIGIGLLAIAALLVVVTVRWLHVLIDAWRATAIQHCGGVLSLFPDRDPQFPSPLPLDPAPEQVVSFECDRRAKRRLPNDHDHRYKNETALPT